MIQKKLTTRQVLETKFQKIAITLLFKWAAEPILRHAE